MTVFENGAVMPTLIVDGPTDGWRTLWIKFVRGFRPDVHCQDCLIGWTLPSLRKKIVPGQPMTLIPGNPGTRSPWRGADAHYDAIYLCGVHESRDWSRNLHLVGIPDPDHLAIAVTRSDGIFAIKGMRRLDIPDLPLGYDGRDKSFTTCRNWRFGVAYYGLDPKRQAFDPRGQRSGLPATQD